MLRLSPKSGTRSFGIAVAAAVITAGAGTAYGQWQVRTYDAPEGGGTVVPLNSFDDADPVFTAPPAGYSTENSTVSQVDLFESGGRGQFTFDLPFGPSYPNNDTDAHNDFTSRVTGVLNLTTGGSFDFFTDTDDGGRLRIDLNRDNAFDATEDVVPASGLQGAGTPERSAVISLNPGTYNYEFSMFERGGGASGEAGYRVSGADTQYVIGDNTGGIGVQGPNNVRTVGPAPLGPLVAIDNIDEGEQVIATQPQAGGGLFSAINFIGEGDDGLVAPSDPFPGVSGDDFALEATGVVDVINGSSITAWFGVNGDDGHRLRVNGVVVDEFPGPRDDPDDGTPLVQLTLNDGDVLRLTWFERGGGDNVEFFLDVDSILATTEDLFLVGTPESGIRIIPEPASAGLLGVGALGLLGRRRRRAL